jgi:hypothetical protein
LFFVLRRTVETGNDGFPVNACRYKVTPENNLQVLAKMFFEAGFVQVSAPGLRK